MLLSVPVGWSPVNFCKHDIHWKTLIINSIFFFFHVHALIAISKISESVPTGTSQEYNYIVDIERIELLTSKNDFIRTERMDTDAPLEFKKKKWRKAMTLNL